MRSDPGNVDSKPELQIVEETQEAAYEPETYELTAEQKVIERRLLWKVDVLIVGLTALIFLVNQWVRTLSAFLLNQTKLSSVSIQTKKRLRLTQFGL